MSSCQNPDLIFAEWITRQFKLVGSGGNPIHILTNYLLVNLKRKTIASIQMEMSMTGAGKYAAIVTHYDWKLEFNLDHHGKCSDLDLAKQAAENALITIGYNRLDDKLKAML